MKALFSSREGHFSLRWITRNTRDKVKGLCISSERHIGVSWAFDALAPEIEDWTRSNRLHCSFFTLIQLPKAYHMQASSILGLRMREEWEFSLRDLRDILKDKPASLRV